MNFSNKPIYKKRSAFTLMELLFVIAIIALLAGLSFPATRMVLLRAKKTQAKHDAVEISSAIIAFQAEFGHPPTEVFNGDLELNTKTDDSLMRVLSSGESNKMNPTGQIFFEGKDAVGGRGGFLTGEGENTYVDPWGEGYIIWIDTDFDGTIVDPSNNDHKIRRKVLVYSKGHKGDETNTKDWILSWK